ncbi:MAG: P-loop NTPase, partial [Fimbriimonadaceae bacterium]|nr:P-loop NTPase [Fimbriimonadaceae bacterium]
MRAITITSGKGGVGKTSIACNLAVSLAQSGLGVVLFDADLQLANIDVALGITPEHHLHHVVAGERTLRETLAPGPGNIRVVSGGSAIPALMNAGP